MFLFGLFYGLGFSSTLDIVQFLGEKLLSLFSFNVGIEIAATVPLLFLALAKVSSSKIVACCSTVIGGLSCVWFLERAFNLSIVTT